LGWLWGAYQLPTNTLWGGFDVALMWLLFASGAPPPRFPPCVAFNPKQAAPDGASLSARKCPLIWVAIYANMGSQTMKTTIEIGDDLFARTQEMARKEKTTFRSLTERGLRLVLEEKLTRSSKWRWKAVVVQGGEGLTDEFKRAPWEKIRDEIYQGHGT
jgi:Arc/MetJ family transcription regulator